MSVFREVRIECQAQKAPNALDYECQEKCWFQQRFFGFQKRRLNPFALLRKVCLFRLLNCKFLQGGQNRDVECNLDLTLECGLRRGMIHEQI